MDQLALEEELRKRLSPESAQAELEAAKDEGPSGGVYALGALADAALGQTANIQRLKAEDKALKERLSKKDQDYTKSLMDYFNKQQKASQPDFFEKLAATGFMKQTQEKQKREADAYVPGFEFSKPEKLPTSDDAKKLKDSSEAVKAFSGLADEAVKSLSNIDLGSGVVGTGTKMFEQYAGLDPAMQSLKPIIADLDLQYKEATRLGALTGPDVGYVQNALGNFSSPMALQKVGIEKAQAELKEAVRRMNDGLKNKAKARGYKPEGEVLQKKIGITPEQAREELKRRGKF